MKRRPDSAFDCPKCDGAFARSCKVRIHFRRIEHGADGPLLWLGVTFVNVEAVFHDVRVGSFVEWPAACLFFHIVV